jgi:mRNA interferase RelE/StbE
LKYTVRLKNKAQASLEKLSSKDLKRIVTELGKLEINPFLARAVKLKGVEGYRIRKRDYRILYTVDKKKKEIYVYRIKHRREVYR